MRRLRVRRPPVWIAFTILGVVFALAATRLVWRTATTSELAGVEVIRFAHWQLEPGVREAFDHLARDYMKLHPQVRIEQLPVPGRVWKQWLSTQLIGGTAPDLIELAYFQNPPDVLSRHFVPLSGALAEPNPYNADHPELRDLSWRESFAGELVPDEHVSYYSLPLLEYYGVPNAIVTVRIFYNRDLLLEVQGHETPPATYADFVALCERIRIHFSNLSRAVAPMAGSFFNVTRLTDAAFSNVTQRLALELDYNRDLALTPAEALITHRRGDWRIDSPPIRASLGTVAAIGRQMPPGWVQLDRTDAMLQFLQGRAVMLATGTWDAGGILQEATFPVGAFKVPGFRPDDPAYGAHVLGPLSEAGTFASLPFGLTRNSRHRERALDFLRFLTSASSNATFARIANWLPVVKGAPVPPATVAFQPEPGGYIRGLNLRGLGTRSNDILQQHIHLLGGDRASVDRYLEATLPHYHQAFPAELARLASIAHELIRRKDSALIGLWQLTPEAALPRSKFDLLAAKQLEVEAERLQAELALQAR